ncbi:MAG TPA: methyl-accepting chemotaxis protein, partial [Tepidisphaeraceae bacterium]|nr:methyl-accepting chemotaxis protein [Tepidisphaeraceae bacterium]
MKLSTRLALGFSVVLAITAALGGVALWKLAALGASAHELVDERMPAATYAAQLRASLANAMISARTFGLTLTDAHRDAARAAATDLAGKTTAGEELLRDHPRLAALEDEFAAIKASLTDWQKTFADTVVFSEQRHAANAKLRRSFAAATTATAEMTAGQNKKLVRDLNDALETDQLLVRARKVTLLGEMRDALAASQMRVTLAMSADDAADVGRGVEAFGAVLAGCDTLATICHSKDDLENIAKIRAASADARAAAADLQANMTRMSAVNAARVRAATAACAQVDALSEGTLKQVLDDAVWSVNAVTIATKLVWGGIATAVVIGALTSLVITRGITKPVNQIIASLTAGSEQTSSAASQVSSASQSLAQGASEQAASLEETGSALEEMSSMTRKNADTAQQAAGLAGEAKSAADTGNAAMGKMSAAIAEIEKSAGETA